MYFRGCNGFYGRLGQHQVSFQGVVVMMTGIFGVF